ncbi:hypothetical protein BpHYR1_035495 [Brachionus plicatilis]|uniref:Uncharacterized protein n=1 Tax=Brachionus plicatilis TaxID=10195 RepID=A0A3M7PBV7_BRAPC|nr:hypothetical protein BpHYR1_035495 [Brachionus plicatilis]
MFLHGRDVPAKKELSMISYKKNAKKYIQCCYDKLTSFTNLRAWLNFECFSNAEANFFQLNFFYLESHNMDTCFLKDSPCEHKMPTEEKKSHLPC